MLPLEDGHEWLSINDEEGTTWLFDVTFLTSNYACIYGQGCHSISDDPAEAAQDIGCCSHGAHFADEEDRRRVAYQTQRLTSQTWQNFDVGSDAAIIENDDREWVTTTKGDACVFLNRSSFQGGAGCALHSGALAAGERPLDWKPEVCWQVPIRLDVHTDDNNHETVLVKAWQRRDWGDGGQDFHWWCMDDQQAFSAETALYKTSADELVEMVGEEVFRKLSDELDRREHGTPVHLTRPS